MAALNCEDVVGVVGVVDADDGSLADDNDNMPRYRPILTPRCQEKRTSLALMWMRSSGCVWSNTWPGE